MEATRRVETCAWAHARTPSPSSLAAWRDALAERDEVRLEVRRADEVARCGVSEERSEWSDRAERLLAEGTMSAACSERAAAIRSLATEIEHVQRVRQAAARGTGASWAALEETLATSTDVVARKDAWLARVAHGPDLAPLVVRLAGHRRAAAQEDGVGPRAVALRGWSLREADVDAAAERIERASRAHVVAQRRLDDARTANRADIPVPELRIWHHASPWGCSVTHEDLRLANTFYRDVDPLDVTLRLCDSIGVNARSLMWFVGDDAAEPSATFPGGPEAGAVSLRIARGIGGLSDLLDAAGRVVLRRYQRGEADALSRLVDRIMGRILAWAPWTPQVATEYGSHPRREALGRGSAHERCGQWARVLGMQHHLVNVAVERVLAGCRSTETAAVEELAQTDAAYRDARHALLGVSPDEDEPVGAWAALPGVHEDGYGSAGLAAELHAYEISRRAVEASRARGLVDSLWVGETLISLGVGRDTPSARAGRLAKLVGGSGVPVHSWLSLISGASRHR